MGQAAEGGVVRESQAAEVEVARGQAGERLKRGRSWREEDGGLDEAETACFVAAFEK
jgi:hypothetical protein